MTRRRTPPGDLRRPTAAQSEFLVACLDRGDRGKEAFEAWLTAGDPAAGLRDPERADRHLFALLHAARRSELPRAIAPVLHAAVVHEQLRAEAVGAAGAEVAATLHAAGYEPLLTGGAALAWGRYEEPWLRHCHNIDLLAARAGEAQAMLGDLGLLMDGCHPSGTPVSIVARPPGIADAERADLAGWRLPMLGAADQLVQLGANAAVRFDPGLRPFADGWILCAGGNVEWERVTERAAATRSAAPISVLLDWLAANGGPLAPEPVRRRLARSRRSELGRMLLTTSPARVRNRLRRAWRDARA
jgi:hypothetical protein